jgi:hypothetical protein
MYKQITPTFPFCSDWDVQQIRMRREQMMKNEVWRTHRERAVLNNKKMWSLSYKENKRITDEMNAELDLLTRAKYGMNNQEMLRLNGDWQNESYVMKYS